MQGQQAVSLPNPSVERERRWAPTPRPSTLDEEWVLHYINFLEQEEAVDQLLVGGLHAWPWARIRIFRELLAPEPDPRPPENRRSLRQRVSAVKQRLSGRVSADWKRLRDQSRVLRDADFLLYSYVAPYQVDQAGLDYDRILDPVCALIGGGANWRKFHVDGWESGWLRKQAVPGVVLPSDAINHLQPTLGPQVEVKAVSRWLAALESRILEETGARIDLAAPVLWTAAAVRRYRDFFRVALDGARASAVLMPCYYGERQSGLIWACRDLGITTVDVQHGKQGVMSLGYGAWPTIPDGGYETMPDMFWVWGRQSARNLRLGAQGQPGMPDIRVTGNMYVAEWAHGAPVDYRSVSPDFWGRLDAAGRVVLVTLQPFAVNRAVPPELVCAMRESSRDWLWLLRIHPGGRPTREEIVALLQANDIPGEKYDIEEAGRQPLYALMKHSDVHVTLWSSCGYEALCFGVPTIFLDDFARTLYGDYLKKGLFYSASSASEILERAEAAGRDWEAHEEEPYIEIDPALTQRALAELSPGHRQSRRPVR